MKRLLFIIGLILIGQTSIAQNDIFITNVNIVDVEKGIIEPDKFVHVRGKKIYTIDKFTQGTMPEGTILLNGNGKFLMPGMIDGHIHFFQTGGLYTRPDAIDLRHIQDYDDERLLALSLTTDHFNRYLRLGVTTVVDVGGPFTNFLIRDSLAKNNLSPNVLLTGPLFSTYQPANLGTNDPPIILTDTKEKVDSLFAKMLPYKPNFIKVWYVVKPGLTAEDSYPIIEYIGQKAHKAGLRYAVHATQLKTAQLAVKAGADILVHSIDDEIIPQDFIEKLKFKDIFYIPTLMVHGGYMNTFTGNHANDSQDIRWANPFVYGSLKDLEGMDTADLPERIKSIRLNKNALTHRNHHGDSIMLANLRMLNIQGLLISTGTDAGNIGTLHASSYLQELAWMKKAGMGTHEILKASTITVAKTFGVEKEIGSIEIGKLADLVLLDKNPLADLNNLNSATHVIKMGKLIKLDTLIKETPEMLVQRQLNAYNARNINEFMATYSDSIELYSFPDKLISKGQETMRARYKKMFDATPNLYCKIVERKVEGNIITDQEHVRVNDKFVDAKAIYEVKYGKIVKVTFVK